MSSQEPVIINEVLREAMPQTDVSSLEGEIVFHRQSENWDISPNFGRKNLNVNNERSPRSNRRDIENGIPHKSKNLSRERSPSVERRGRYRDHSPSSKRDVGDNHLIRRRDLSASLSIGKQEVSADRSPRLKRSPDSMKAPPRTEQKHSPKSKSKHKSHRSSSRERDLYANHGNQDNVYSYHGNNANNGRDNLYNQHSSIKDNLYNSHGNAQKENIYGHHGYHDPGYDTLENNLMKKGDTKKMDLQMGRNHHMDSKEPLYMDIDPVRTRVSREDAATHRETRRRMEDRLSRLGHDLYGVSGTYTTTLPIP